MVALDALHVRDIKVKLLVSFGSPLGQRDFWGKLWQDPATFPYDRLGSWLNIVNLNDPVTWKRGASHRFPQALDTYISAGDGLMGPMNYHDAATYTSAQIPCPCGCGGDLGPARRLSHLRRQRWRSGLWTVAAGSARMDQSLHMAAPLDPERWDEFARPRPRLQPQARPQPRPASDGLAAAQSQVRVGDLLDKAAGGHQALPISAVAALVAQFANLLLTEPQAATSEFNLRSAHVSRDGPAGTHWSGARSDALLRLLRQALNEAAVPPAVARLLPQDLHRGRPDC